MVGGGQGDLWALAGRERCGFAEEAGGKAGAPTSTCGASFSESEVEGKDVDGDGDEDEDANDSSAEDGVACFFRPAFWMVVLFGTSSDEEDARRRLRFRSAVGVAVGISCCLE